MLQLAETRSAKRLSVLKKLRCERQYSRGDREGSSATGRQAQCELCRAAGYKNKNRLMLRDGRAARAQHESALSWPVAKQPVFGLADAGVRHPAPGTVALRFADCQRLAARGEKRCARLCLGGVAGHPRWKG